MFTSPLTTAGSDYQDPGIGYLKESTSGDLVFTRDSKFADKKHKILRIRVEKDGVVTSSFTGAKDYTDKSRLDAEIELFKARDSLFDEELYHEVPICCFSLMASSLKKHV